MKPKIGFIGTGVMGGSMALNLLKNGYELAAYNRSPQKTRPLSERGAAIMPSVGELSGWADVVISIVGFPRDVEEVYLGPDGVLARLRTGGYAIDMTTSSPRLALKIHSEAKKKGIFALDAPVSGGDVGARDATLSIMVGGDEEAFKAMLPVFSAMGSSVRLHGGPGAGQHAKMCNQISIAAGIVGVCESLAYAKKAGLDGDKILETLGGGAAASRQLSLYAPRIFKGDYQPGFYIKHFVKDLGIAIEEAESMGLELPMLKLAKTLYDRLVRDGMGELGIQALYAGYLADR